jgi:hypothetical protein
MIMMPIPEGDDGITALDIVTAKTLYRAEKHSNSIWYIKERFWEAKELLYSSPDPEESIQAWQYLKAYTQILKDKKQWDYEHGSPFYNPEWADMIPYTDEWKEYYNAHQKEQFSMFQYQQYWEEEGSNG